MLVACDRVLAGVSGGADSVCLLLVLKELEYDIAVAHVNHGLRGAESDEDEEFTRQLAERLGVKFFGKRVSLPAEEGNIEAAGREARKEFFAELVREHGFTKIALAHTKNDRVETFMMNLLRGSGSEGLVSMAPVTASTVRPLIESTRQDIEAYMDGPKPGVADGFHEPGPRLHPEPAEARCDSHAHIRVQSKSDRNACEDS